MFSFIDSNMLSRRCVWVNGPLIVGAGSSGLAVAACLKEQAVPFVILERADCIASLWQKRTYDRLKLHLPERFCQLSGFPFPDHYPEYPTKNQFIKYLECYAAHFGISPQFNECVESAKYDQVCHLWRVNTVSTEYVCQRLVVATGENAELELEGLNLKDFRGEVIHACDYKSGDYNFRGQKVLVMGSRNSGMEVSLDLCNHDAKPSMVVRCSVDELPGEVSRWRGNMENSHSTVIDIGALEKMRSKEIELVPGIKRFSCDMVELANGEKLEIDLVVLATGYCSNVPYWLQQSEFFPTGWKGKDGLYAVRGLRDAIKVSQDIAKVWKDGLKQKKQVRKHELKQKKQKVVCTM